LASFANSVISSLVGIFSWAKKEALERNSNRKSTMLIRILGIKRAFIA
jgi:hypothetical protein